jgi:hypothetical protein
MGILRGLIAKRRVEEETLPLEIGLQRITGGMEGIVGTAKGEYYMDTWRAENQPAILPEKVPTFVRYHLYPYFVQEAVFVHSLSRNRLTRRTHHVIDITPKEPQQGVARDRVVIEYDTR